MVQVDMPVAVDIAGAGAHAVGMMADSRALGDIHEGHRRRYCDTGDAARGERRRHRRATRRQVGQLAETVVVSSASPTVDVQSARQAMTFQGADLKELPTSRNVNSLLALTPAINSNYRTGQAFGQPGVCVGGISVFCNPGLAGFNVGDNAQGFLVNGIDPLGVGNTVMAQGRVMVDGQVVNSGANLPIVGRTGGFTADIASAQEINVQVPGSAWRLGDRRLHDRHLFPAPVVTVSR